MEQYFEEKPLSKENIMAHDININNNKYIFYTSGGVFSKKGLDFGTRNLLLCLPIDKMKGSVLDLGCGYGPIGIYLLKNTGSKLTMSDINERALELTAKNLKVNKVEATLLKSDGLNSLKEKYNYIVTNPPIRIGYKKLLLMMKETSQYLEKSGELWFVIKKKQGAERLIKDLGSEYNIEVANKVKGYYIAVGTLK